MAASAARPALPPPSASSPAHMPAVLPPAPVHCTPLPAACRDSTRRRRRRSAVRAPAGCSLRSTTIVVSSLTFVRLELGDAPVLSALLDSRRSFCGEVLAGTSSSSWPTALRHRYRAGAPLSSSAILSAGQSKDICRNLRKQIHLGWDLADARGGQNATRKCFPRWPMADGVADGRWPICFFGWRVVKPLHGVNTLTY